MFYRRGAPADGGPRRRDERQWLALCTLVYTSAELCCSHVAAKQVTTDLSEDLRATVEAAFLYRVPVWSTLSIDYNSLRVLTIPSQNLCRESPPAIGSRSVVLENLTMDGSVEARVSGTQPCPVVRVLWPLLQATYSKGKKKCHLAYEAPPCPHRSLCARHA